MNTQERKKSRSILLVLIWEVTERSFAKKQYLKNNSFATPLTVYYYSSYECRTKAASLQNLY
jgi:hypothetical protein